MDVSATYIQSMVNRLLDQICEYENRHGEPPKCIIASHRAYLLIENYCIDLCLRHTDMVPAPYFKGIEVRVCSGDGYDIFLAGEPITLR